MHIQSIQYVELIFGTKSKSKNDFALNFEAAEQ